MLKAKSKMKTSENYNGGAINSQITGVHQKTCIYDENC